MSLEFDMLYIIIIFESKPYKVSCLEGINKELFSKICFNIHMKSFPLFSIESNNISFPCFKADKRIPSCQIISLNSLIKYSPNR